MQNALCSVEHEMCAAVNVNKQDDVKIYIGATSMYLEDPEKCPLSD